MDTFSDWLKRFGFLQRLGLQQKQSGISQDTFFSAIRQVVGTFYVIIKYKWIVHPKIKNPVIILKLCKQLIGHIHFHSIFPPYYVSQLGPSTVWLQTVFKISNIHLCSAEEKIILVWKKLRVSKMIHRIFIFG